MPQNAFRRLPTPEGKDRTTHNGCAKFLPSPVWLLAALLALATQIPSAHAGTVATTNDVRTISSGGNYSGDTYLSLYNDGGANVQRTWLKFDLSTYAGQIITSDATLTLVADTTYGTHLAGVALGTADAAWNFAAITWSNQPTLTPIPGTTCPNGDFNNGVSVVWSIPATVLQAWVDHGYNGIGLTSAAGSTLHFRSSRGGAAPTLSFTAVAAGGPRAGGAASPSTLAPGQSTLLSVTVTNGLNPNITNVTVDASQLGAASLVALRPSGSNVFTNTVTVGPGTVYGNQALLATVTDGAGLQGQATIPVFLPTPGAQQAPTASLNTWRSNRFGMFIHWGPVTLTGLEISWSRANSNPLCPNNGPTAAAVYDNLYTQFNPTNFNASNWVAIAQAAGMKYMVLTAKHCDGFLLWDSKVSSYNIMQSPFRRDVCGELAAAAHAAGMKLGWYFSPMDWKDPRFRTAQNADFVQTMQAELRELLSNYGTIDLLWFDTDGDPNVYDVTNTYAMCRSLQPGIVIDNRLDMGSMSDYTGQLIGPWADYYTPEQRIGGFDNQRPWETCMTLGTQWAWKPNDTIKSLSECLTALLLCAGGDGNFLFDLGPTSTGTFEQTYSDRIAGMGGWIAQNGESVYGTRGGPYQTSGNFSCTRNGNSIYLHLLPPQAFVTLPALPTNVVAAKVLTGGSVTFAQTTNGVSLQLSSEAATNLVTTVKLTLAGSAMDIPLLSAGVLSSAPTTNTWQAPGLITTSSEVSTLGGLVLACQATSSDAGGNADQTVNGVLFSGSQNPQNGVGFTLGGQPSYNASTFISTKALSGPDAPAYGRMLAGAWYGSTAPLTLGLNGLSPGRAYLLQLWVADFRSYTNARTETITAGAGVDFNIPTLRYLTGDGVNPGSGTGQFVLGTFTATGSTATFTLTGNQSSQLNAFQLREVTPPALSWSVNGPTLTLYWPADHIGWTLMTQTNALSRGVSAKAADWMRLAGSAATNRIVVSLPSQPASFFRLVYP